MPIINVVAMLFENDKYVMTPVTWCWWYKAVINA